MMRENLVIALIFLSMPQFSGGNITRSLTHFGIWWIDKQRLLGEILSTIRKDGLWSVLLVDPPNSSLPQDLCFWRYWAMNRKEERSTVTPKVTSHSSSPAKKRNSRKRVSSKENILGTQAACFGSSVASELTHRHSRSSLEPRNCNENIPGNQIPGAGGGGKWRLPMSVTF